MITIKDFKVIDGEEMVYVEWKEVERVLGKKRYKEFCSWMNGQTCSGEGAYACDVEIFLRKPQNRFFD